MRHGPRALIILSLVLTASILTVHGGQADSVQPTVGAEQETPKPPKTKPENGQTLTGQCHCGAVKYEAKGPVVKSSHCDCRGCQRATGAIQIPFVTVFRSGFILTTGKTTEFRSDIDKDCDGYGTWHFCAACGTQLFWKGDKGDHLDVFAGTLDDTAVHDQVVARQSYD